MLLCLENKFQNINIPNYKEDKFTQLHSSSFIDLSFRKQFRQL